MNTLNWCSVGNELNYYGPGLLKQNMHVFIEQESSAQTGSMDYQCSDFLADQTEKELVRYEEEAGSPLSATLQN